jgi:hypothetical protein
MTELPFPMAGTAGTQGDPNVATMSDFTEALQEQVASGVKQAQEINVAVLEAARDFAGLFQSVQGDHGDSKRMPDGTKLIDEMYGFAGRLLELQHDYAVRVVEALTPTFPERTRTATERRAQAADERKAAVAEERRAAAEERKAAAEERKGSADKP